MSTCKTKTDEPPDEPYTERSDELLKCLKA